MAITPQNNRRRDTLGASLVSRMLREVLALVKSISRAVPYMNDNAPMTPVFPQSLTRRMRTATLNSVIEKQARPAFQDPEARLGCQPRTRSLRLERESKDTWSGCSALFECHGMAWGEEAPRCVCELACIQKVVKRLVLKDSTIGAETKDGSIYTIRTPCGCSSRVARGDP